MLTLLDRIHQKLPQASESVLAQVWTILNLSESANEDDELHAEFDRWEAASDEDEAQIEAMLATKGV
jgi:ferric-dicitrate binding protein FerR (iron transport regulator)